MKLTTKIVVGALACVSLTGCNLLKSNKEPTGQVVATVDGKEITLLALRAEMGNNVPADAKARKAAEIATLQNLVNRKIIAETAREKKVEKAPQYAIQKERMEEGLLVQALQSNIASQIPTPTRQEAQQYIAAHPATFAERKIFTVDQIRMGRPNNPAVLQQLQPLKTLEEVTSVLQANGIAFQRVEGKIDGLSIQPELMIQIAKLPPGEMFVIPANGGLVVNAIRSAEARPFVGDPAIKLATNVLRSQRQQKAVNDQFKAFVDQGKSSVKYNKDYAPPPPAAKGNLPAKPGAPAAPAPKAG